jgi:hypothetical protein
MSAFVSGGAGWSWTFYKLKADGKKDSYPFNGFTWQASAGLAYTYDDEFSSMKVFLEGGYRGTNVKTDIGGTNFELAMSAPFVRIGVAFPLGGSDY